MSINLETLVLSYEADFSKFEANLDRAVNIAQSRAKTLQSLKIVPQVDLSQLHALNKLLDTKQKHLKETIDFFNRNPIKPQSGGTAIKLGNGVNSKLELLPVVNAINSLKSALISESTKTQNTIRQNTSETKKANPSNTASIIKVEAFKDIFKASKKLDISQFFKPALKQFADSTAISLGFEMEFTEGATRISEALQKGFQAGVKEIRAILTEQITQEFGIPLKNQNSTSRKPQANTSLNTVNGSSLRNALIQNEIIIAQKEGIKAGDALTKAKASPQFIRIQTNINNLENKLARYEALVNKEQSKANPNQNKLSTYSNKISRISKQITQETLKPDFKAVEDLRKNSLSIQKQIANLQEAQSLSKESLDDALDALSSLSTKQLESKLKELEKDNSSLSSKLKDYKPLREQATRFNRVSAALEKDIEKNQKLIQQAKAKKNLNAQRIAEVSSIPISEKGNQNEIKKTLDKLQKQSDKYTAFINAAKSQNFGLKKELLKIEKLKSALASEQLASGLPEIDKQLNASLRKTKAVKDELNKRYSKIPALLKDVGAMIGLNVDYDKLPNFEQFESETQRGFYNGLTNTLGINSKYASDLNKRASEVSSDLVATLAHELSHGMQSGFDAQSHQLIAKGVKKPKLLNNLKKITKEESTAIGSRMGSFYDDRSTYVKLKEIDAYLTGLRVKKRTEAIKKVSTIDTTLVKEVESITSFQSVILKKAREMLATGKLQSSDGEQVITALNAVKSRVANLKDFSLRSKVEGTLDPEKFIKEFEDELDKIRDFKKAIFEGVLDFNPDAGLQLPDSQGKVKKQRKSKRENAIEQVTNISEAVSRLGNNSIKATESLNSLSNRLKSIVPRETLENNLDILSDSTKDKSKENDTKEAPIDAKKLETNALTAVSKKLDLLKADITPLKQLRSLSIAQQKYIGAKDSQALASSINELNTALVATESSPESKNEITRQKASLANMLKARVKLLKNLGVDIEVDTPSLKEVKARKAQQETNKIDLSPILNQSQLSGDLLDYEIGDIKEALNKLRLVLSDTEITKKLKEALSPKVKPNLPKPNATRLEEISNRVEVDSQKPEAVQINESLKDQLTNTSKGLFDSLKGQFKSVFDFIKININARMGPNKFIDSGTNPEFLVNDSIQRFETALNNFENWEQQQFDDASKEVARVDLTNPNNKQRVSSKRVATDTGAKVRESYDFLRDSLVKVLNLDSPVLEMLENFSTGFVNAGKGALGFKSELIAVGTLFAAFALVAPIKELARFQIELDNVNKRLQAVNEVPSTNLFEEFGDAANKANLRVLAFAEGYSSLTASLKGKLPNARETIFGLTEGLAQRGVAGESQERALNALSQMAGKGVVSMEELRSQLGEHLAGSLAIASRSMGLTERQMIALVSSGELLATEFLPKFANELKNTIASSTTFTTELTKLQNAFDEIKFNVASVIPFKQVLQSLNWIVNQLLNAIKPFSIVLATLFAALTLNLAFNLVKLVASLAIFKQILSSTLLIFKPLILATVAVGSAMASFDALFVSSAFSTRRLNKELQALAKEGMTEVKEAGKTGYQSKNPLTNLLNNTQLEGLTERSRIREERINLESNAQALNPLNSLKLQYKEKTIDENITGFKYRFNKELVKDKDIGYKIANREQFGITQEEALRMQQGLNDRSKGRDSLINSFFNKDTLTASLQQIEQLRKNIQLELDKGADASKYFNILAELDITEDSLRDAQRKINSIVTLSSPLIVAGLDARASQATLSNRVSKANTAIDQRVLDDLNKNDYSSRRNENLTRFAQLDKFSSEREITNQSNKAAQTQIGLLGDAQKQRLQDLLGTTRIFDASYEQIFKAREKLAIEQEGGAIPDKNLENAIDNLDVLATNTQRLAEIQQQASQFTLETSKIVKELGYEFSNLKVESLQKRLSILEFNRDVQRQLSPDNDTNFQLSREIEKEAFDAKRALFDMRENFAQTTRGIQDFNYGLATSTRELKNNLLQAGRELITAAIASTSNYLSAAGLEDTLGLNKFRDLLTRGIGITQSDKRPQLQNEIKDKTRDFERQTDEQERNQARLNMDVESNIFNLQQQIAESKRTGKFTVEDRELDFERLKVRYYELENDARTFSRTIEGFNDTAKDYNLSKRLQAPSTNLTPLSAFEGLINEDGSLDTSHLIKYLESQYEKLNANRASVIDEYRKIQVQGNADIDREQAKSAALYQEQVDTYNSSIETEGKRIVEANNALSKELSAIVFSINQNLATQLNSFTRLAIDMKASVSQIFKDVGIQLSTEDLLDNLISGKNQEIDARILEMRQASEKISEYLKEEDPLKLKELIQGSDLDESLKSKLLNDLSMVTSSKDFNKVIQGMEGLATHYEGLTNVLEANREDVIKAAKEDFFREGNRKIEDANQQIEQESINNVPYLSPYSKGKLQLEFDISQSNLELKRQLEDLERSLPKEQFSELKTSLTELNQIKLERLRREASLTYQVLTSLQSSLESSISNALVNFGENLFKIGEGKDKLQEINAGYGEELKGLEETYSDDFEGFKKAKERLDVINESKLDKVRNEFSLLGGVMNTIKNVVIDLGKTILETIAKIAAQQAASAIIGTVAKVFGGTDSSGLIGAFTGQTANFSSSTSFSGGFKNGGEIGGGNVTYGLGNEIKTALAREGSKGTLIVASKGEQVLSTVNGEAQLYRALVKSGEWRQIKNEGINNFRLGGEVGKGLNSRTYERPIRGRTSNVNVSNTYNVKVSNTDQLRKTQQQLIQEAESRSKRIVNRNS